MKNLTKKLKQYKGIIVATVQMVVVAALLWKFFVPTVQSILSQRDELKTKQEEYQEIVDYVSYLRDLAAQSLDIEEAIIDYALPTENDVITLIVTYEGFADSKGITISSLELSSDDLDSSQDIDNAETAANSPVAIEFDANITAETQEDAIAFLQEVYKARRLFAIKELHWEHSSEGGDLGGAGVGMTLGKTTLLAQEPGESSDPEIVDPELGTGDGMLDQSPAGDSQGIIEMPEADILLDQNNGKEETQSAVNMLITFVVYYYPVANVEANSSLVKKGQLQTDFISVLRDTKVYDDVVLEGVVVGKDDLFGREGFPEQTSMDNIGSGELEGLVEETIPIDEPVGESASPIGDVSIDEPVGDGGDIPDASL